MLDDEDKIVENGQKSQHELRDVKSVLSRSCSACKGKRSSDKIKEDVEDRPPLGALPFIVPIGWGSVFQEGDKQLAVTE